MAEENKRKSSRSFDLGKKSACSFDLRKDDDADDVKLPPASEPRQSGSEPQNGGGKNWLWVVIAIIVVALLAFFLLRGCGKGDEATEQPAAPQPAESVQAQPSPEPAAPEPADAVQEQQPDAAPAQPDVAPAAEPEAPAEPAKPAQPAPAAQPSASARSSVDDIEAMALRVIRGDFGNNPDRRQKLGDDYQVIQNRVNELMRQ